jgi:hypothetical protein
VEGVTNAVKLWFQMEFPKGHCVLIWKHEDKNLDQEIDGTMKCERMEE